MKAIKALINTANAGQNEEQKKDREAYEAERTRLSKKTHEKLDTIKTTTDKTLVLLQHIARPSSEREAENFAAGHHKGQNENRREMASLKLQVMQSAKKLKRANSLISRLENDEASINMPAGSNREILAASKHVNRRKSKRVKK